MHLFSQYDDHERNCKPVNDMCFSLILSYAILLLIISWSHILYLTDIPRQREEYEVIYGTRRNAECHITSILRAVLFYDKLTLHFCHKIKQSYPTQT